MAFAGTVRGMYIAFSNVMAAYNWRECAFLYTISYDIDAVCSLFAATFTTYSNETDAIVPVGF